MHYIYFIRGRKGGETCLFCKKGTEIKANSPNASMREGIARQFGNVFEASCVTKSGEHEHNIRPLFGRGEGWVDKGNIIFFVCYFAFCRQLVIWIKTDMYTSVAPINVSKV